VKFTGVGSGGRGQTRQAFFSMTVCQAPKRIFHRDLADVNANIQHSQRTNFSLGDFSVDPASTNSKLSHWMNIPLLLFPFKQNVITIK
jgi:hypothetical protein